MRNETIIKVVAIVCLTVICVTALLRNIDSFIVSAISGIIGGIAGYEVGRIKALWDKTK